jgi:hypothetical protein
MKNSLYSINRLANRGFGVKFNSAQTRCRHTRYVVHLSELNAKTWGNDPMVYQIKFLTITLINSVHFRNHAFISRTFMHCCGRLWCEHALFRDQIKLLISSALCHPQNTLPIDESEVFSRVEFCKPSNL